jgi:hypothetical protein
MPWKPILIPSGREADAIVRHQKKRGPGALTKTGKDRIVPFAPKGRLAGVPAMRRHDPAGDALPAGTAASHVENPANTLH